MESHSELGLEGWNGREERRSEENHSFGKQHEGQTTNQNQRGRANSSSTRQELEKNVQLYFFKRMEDLQAKRSSEGKQSNSFSYDEKTRMEGKFRTVDSSETLFSPESTTYDEFQEYQEAYNYHFPSSSSHSKSSQQTGALNNLEEQIAATSEKKLKDESEEEILSSETTKGTKKGKKKSTTTHRLAKELKKEVGEEAKEGAEEESAGVSTATRSQKTKKSHLKQSGGYLMDVLLLFLPSLYYAGAAVYSADHKEYYEKNTNILLSLGTMGFVLKWLNKIKSPGIYIAPFYLLFSQGLLNGKWKKAIAGSCLWYCANLLLVTTASGNSKSIKTSSPPSSPSSSSSIYSS